MRLSELLDLVNLPDVIARECGYEAAHGLNRERGGVIRDPRPGCQETRASFSVYRGKGGRWRWKRHGGGDNDRGDALAFLEAIGYRPEHAREELARHAGVSLDAWCPTSHRPTYAAPDPVQETRAVLARCTPFDEREVSKALGLLTPLGLQDAAGRDLKQRGLFGCPDLQAGRLRRDFITRDGRKLAHAGALGVLLFRPDGQMCGLKVRNIGTADDLRAADLDRYVYRIGGHGAPAWCSPDYGQGEALLIVEGELNGVAAARAAQVAGLSLDIQGLAGAGGTPFLEGMAGRAVYLYADDDAAGAACLARLGKLAQAAGALEVRTLAPLPEGDFCELCGTLGAAAFGAQLQAMSEAAQLWRPGISGKTGLPQIKSAPSAGKVDLWQCGTTDQDWTATDGGWGLDKGGW